MNLFHKKSDNYFLKEEEITELNQYTEIPESEQKVSSGTGEIKEKSLYQPNPALFRRLIEGTSFDQRKRVEEDQYQNKIDQEPIKMIQFTNKPSIEIPTVSKKEEYKISSSPSLNRKKFIKKERENRLGNLVHEVLGYPVDKQDK